MARAPHARLVSLIAAALLLAAMACGRANAQAPAPAQPYLNAYAIPATAQAYAQRWATEFKATPGQRVAFDARTNQLLVLGDEQLHRFVVDMIARAGQTPPRTLPAATTDADTAILPIAAAPAAPVAGQLQLNNLTGTDLHARLEKLVGKPLPVTTDATSARLRFTAELVPGRGVNIDVESAGRTGTLNGDPAQVAAWQRVILAMDRGAVASDQVTQLVSTKAAPKQTVERALSLLGGQAAPAAGDQPGQVTLVLQQADPLPGAQATPPAGQTPPAGAPAVPGPLADPGSDTALVGPVQIEFVEGLDIIVLRGNQRDVERVMRIINEIEQLSSITVPSIEVLQLEHVESRAMAALLDRVYTQVLGPRTGSVSITPLVKPNALLLIGRPENVKTAVDLVKRVDQPVEPATQFEVFPLRHATASDAKTLIDEFLAEQEEQQGQDNEIPTLAPRARVVADARTNSLIVTAGQRDLAQIAEIVRRLDVERGTAVDEVRVFRLQNTLATDLVTTLQSAIAGTETTTGEGTTTARQSALSLVTIDPLNNTRLESGVLANVTLAADQRANAIVVTAPTSSMQLIAALIEQLDRAPNAEAELKVFTIANGDATSLLEMLQALFRTEEDDDTAAIGAGENSLIRLQLSVDARTNSIIAAGTADDLSVVEALLQTLDASDVRDRQAQVYRLKNSFALDVATSLNEYLQARRDAEEAAELAISPFEQIDREVIIVPDEASNSLIVSATAKYFADIQRLIEQLDERPPMVMIQVLIAEVRMNDTDEFGMELGLQDSVLFDRSILAPTTNSPFQTITTTTQSQSAGGATVATTNTQTIVNAPLSPGFNFGNPSTPLGNNGSSQALATAGRVGAQGLSSFGVNRINSDLGFGGFVFSASSNSVNFLLRALQENRRLEVLSRPQIMALDNQIGVIRVGQRVPRIAGVNTTQFGQNNSVVYEDVGIILQVRPRISPDGLVVMEISAEKSQVGSADEGIPIFAGADGTVVNAPRIDQTVAQTTIAALTGQTVVLSGLLTKQTTDIHRSVPLLSEIPLIGDLFRYDLTAEQRTELLIIMTPRIVNSEQDADMLKQVESSRMNWVLCDVINLHGPSGLKSRCDEWTDAECPACYPTELPAGVEIRDNNGYEIEVETAPAAGPQLNSDAKTNAAPKSNSGVVPSSYSEPASSPRAGSAVGATIPSRLPPVTN